MKKWKMKLNVSLRKNFKSIIPSMVREMVSSLEKVIAKPERKNKLHQERIAGKTLRYSIEVLETTPNAKKYFSDIKKLIQLMGDIHDLDVSIRTLEDFLNEKFVKEKHPTTIRKIISQQKRDRIRLFQRMGRMVAHWKKHRFDRNILQEL